MATPHPDIPTAKQALRDRIRAERRARPVAQREADAEAIAAVLHELPEVQAAECVTAYASMPTEPGTGPLRAALKSAGTRTLLPIVLDGGRLDWAQDDGQMQPARGLGGEEPIGPRLGESAIGEATLVLIPALAVDTLGHRLGQGAGYYDRALLLVPPTVPVVAVVYEGEVLDAAVEPVPSEPHDRQVDAVITPHRCLWLTPRPVH